MRVATLRATVVIRAGSIPTTRSAMTASTAAQAVSSRPSQAAVTLPALTVASWPVRTLPSRRGKRPARVAARPTLRPAAHCPTPVARDTSEEVIASTNPTSWWTWTGPRSVSRVSCEPACAIATSCAPSTALATPCRSPVTSNSSSGRMVAACGSQLADRTATAAARIAAHAVSELAGRHTSSYSNTRTNPRVVHSQWRCRAVLFAEVGDRPGRSGGQRVETPRTRRRMRNRGPRRPEAQ